MIYGKNDEKTKAIQAMFQRKSNSDTFDLEAEGREYFRMVRNLSDAEIEYTKGKMKVVDQQ